jgi:hypothetical protein
MATNVYFNPFPKNQITSEQLLIEDLVIEALKIYGMDVFYLPRSSRDTDDMIYGEDVNKQYVTAYPIELYLENITGMDGEQDFISKFGLEIRDEISLLVSRRRFLSTVPQSRPKEGDLIYVPLVQNFFEITFVEHENNQAMFYTLGRGRGANVYVYALKLKQFVFSNEIVETGVKEVDDQIRDAYQQTILNITSGAGSYQYDEIVYQGSSYATATAKAKVYSNTGDTKLNVYRKEGDFIPGELVKGVTSGVSKIIVTSDDMLPMDTAFEDVIDNNRFETESAEFIDFSETNPFSEATVSLAQLGANSIVTTGTFVATQDSTRVTMDLTELTMDTD